MVAVAGNDTMGHLLEMWAALSNCGPPTVIVFF